MQELLAPEVVVFYDQDWIEIGNRSLLKDVINEATHISPEHMKHPRNASVAIKMSWASHRETSREEDMAYSLLGLFDINMPLIYGEGEKAFLRLQSEIIRTSSDESIYAWCDRGLWKSGLLARSPKAFNKSFDIVPMEGPSSLRRSPPYMTSRGLAIEVLESQNTFSELGHNKNSCIVPLNCARLALPQYPCKLVLESRGQFASRTDVSKLEFYEIGDAESHKFDENVKSETLYVENKNRFLFNMSFPSLNNRGSCWPLIVKLSQAARDITLFFKYHIPPKYVVFSLKKSLLISTNNFGCIVITSSWKRNLIMC